MSQQEEKREKTALEFFGLIICGFVGAVILGLALVWIVFAPFR